MGLSDLPLRRSYRSGDSNIAADFMVPCLAESHAYDRATGYFTSGVLLRLVEGMEPFVRSNGRMRLVASPHLKTSDVKEIEDGYRARDEFTLEAVKGVIAELRSEHPTAYARLSWLIANRVLDIRFAVPRDRGRAGIYHEKFGIFGDGVDFVAFTGSLNETLAALDSNFEYIDVFTLASDAQRIEEKRSYFNRLWIGETPLLEVMDLPEIIRQDLMRDAPKEYPALDGSAPAPSQAVARRLAEHQTRALQAWRSNGMRGILEMATGTGKTYTALTAVSELLKTDSIRCAVMLAPQIAIADQWRQEAEKVLGMAPIVCHSQSGDWRSRLRTRMTLSRHDGQPMVVVALYDTAGSEDFKALAERFVGPVVVVADEVHNVTVNNAADVLLDAYDYRLALSATPDRYLDDIGTQKIRAFFHDVVFRYPLSEAISDGVLTPYDYFPIICDPSDAHGNTNLAGVHAAKFHRFVETYQDTDAADHGFTLVYCQWQQIAEVKRWLGLKLGKPIHTFTAEEDLEQRKEILADFGAGVLEVLVAMRCLDEGVDVPPTRAAFLLASSENPKQFVQRRGRVLRQYPGKHSASIYDFVYLGAPHDPKHEAEIRKELTRFIEFAMAATNHDDAVSTLMNAARTRGISLDNFALQSV